MTDLELLRKCFPAELKSGIRFDLDLAASMARHNCSKCLGRGYTLVVKPDGTNQYSYCEKSLCSEYNIRKIS